MNWEEVVDKLRATADQHATDAQTELLRGNKNNAERSHNLSEIFYGMMAAFEAGLEK